MAEQYDPSNYNVTEVNDYLATADADEKARVLQAERDGQGRKGILGDDETPEEPQGLASTGNPNDLAQKGSTPDGTAAHQEGAPPELAEAADQAEELGYLGVGVEDKPDYSQANPDVMGRG
jgi:hypothetical protein